MSVCAPTGGVQGELAWYPFKVRAGWQSACMLTRLTRMNTNEWTRKALCVQRELVRRNCKCWLMNMKYILSESAEGKEIWMKWWDLPDFVHTTNECKDVNIIDGKQVKIPWESICHDVLRKCAVSEWYIHEIECVNAKSVSCKGGNKLRTYALYKREWGYEPYLNMIDDRNQRLLLTKFRLGMCPLRIETGRREAVGRGQNYLDASRRFCLCCNTERVEDEIHFLLVCPIYDDLRIKLVNVVNIYISNVITDPPVDRIAIFGSPALLFSTIMSAVDKNVIKALVQYLIYAFKRRESVLYA